MQGDASQMDLTRIWELHIHLQEIKMWSLYITAAQKRQLSF